MLKTIVSEDTISPILSDTFNRESSDASVIIAHGYGIKITLTHGQLTINDGLGRHTRIRRIPKADRTIKRIIVTGQSGYVSLEALRFCHNHGISVSTFDPNAELVAHYTTPDIAHHVSLVRQQVHSLDTEKSLEIAREIEELKLTGQCSNLIKLFNELDTAAKIALYRERISTAYTIRQLSEIESWAAREYFNVWRNHVAVTWDKASVDRVPVNWLGYLGRSNRTRNRQNAADPVNAMLNYAYTLGYLECRIACIEYGLDPRLGYLHSDKEDRDSLALDVLEVIRPVIDEYIITLLQTREFSHRSFTEPYGLPPGTCRLVAPLTHEIAEASYAWHKQASEMARTIASILSGHAGKRGDNLANVNRERLAFTSVAVTVDEVLPDKLWQEIAPLVPPWPRKTYRPPTSDRTMVAAMVYMERHGRPWAHVPASLGVSHRTMTERRRMWQRSGHWPAIHSMIKSVAQDG